MAPTQAQLKYINDLAAVWRPDKQPSAARTEKARVRAERLFLETLLRRAMGVETKGDFLGVEVPQDVTPETTNEVKAQFIRDYVDAWRQARVVRTRDLLNRRELLSTRDAAELIELLR